MTRPPVSPAVATPLPESAGARLYQCAVCVCVCVCVCVSAGSQVGTARQLVRVHRPAVQPDVDQFDPLSLDDRGSRSSQRHQNTAAVRIYTPASLATLPDRQTY